MSQILCLKCGALYGKNENNYKECIDCHSNDVVDTEDLNYNLGDYFELTKISHDGKFIYEMLKLKSNDPIEYQIKLQQLQSTSQQSNQPKCPTCGSTNIEKITAGKKMGGAFLFGIFSSDVRNTMHCKDCGAKW